jgi:hypothetical protein
MIRCLCLLILAAVTLATAQRRGSFGRIQNPNPVPPSAETNAGPTTGPYTLGGTVVNGVTGEPIARALVHLNTQSQRMTMSGPDGRFQFESLPEGSATVFAQKPGFFSPQEMGLGAAPYAIIQIGKDSTEVKVSLYPTGGIAGRITSTGGDPLRGVQVRAIYQHIVNGEARWEERGSAVSDDSGSYRILNLIPGKYYAATRTHPVHVLSPGMRSFGQHFDDVYPALYYAGSADATGASIIQVVPGQQAEADFSESPQKAYSVSGTVPDAASERLAFSLLDRDGYQTSASAERKGNTFRFHNVLPGEYTVFVNASTNRNEPSYGIAQVGVNNADVEGVTIEMSPSATIPIQMDWDKPPSGSVIQAVPQVHLSPVAHNPWNSGYWSRVDTRDGQQVQIIDRVMPGNYRVTIQPNAQGYVAAIRSGQTDLMQNELVVAPGSPPAPIQVTFHSGAATLTGTVKADGPAPHVYVLALPDFSSPVETPVIGSSGKFTASGLAPGSYHVFAFASIDGLEFQNKEAMRKYDNQAVSVTLSENETKQIEVPLIGGGPT